MLVHVAFSNISNHVYISITIEDILSSPELLLSKACAAICWIFVAEAKDPEAFEDGAQEVKN